MQLRDASTVQLVVDGGRTSRSNHMFLLRCSNWGKSRDGNMCFWKRYINTAIITNGCDAMVT
eukprot:4380129-Karenia_brevis.AAC.1